MMHPLQRLGCGRNVSGPTLIRHRWDHCPVRNNKLISGTASILFFAPGSIARLLIPHPYTPLELECLAIVWAILKCSFYLRGLPSFTVLTDHRPLEGIFQKDIFDLASPRLQRLREKIAMYSFLVRRVPGKTHFIADALSLKSFQIWKSIRPYHV